MPDPAQQSENEIREGTEALESIADDVEQERAKSDQQWAAPGADVARDDEATTREDHRDTGNDTLYEPDKED